MPHPKLVLLALSFYTRLPCPKHLDYKLLPQAATYLPIIGWVVGSLCALSFYLAHLLWHESTALIVAMITGIFLTGAFHEDGFADVCDGFGGGWDKQQILTIMKDSQIGTYGAVGLILLLLLKANSLNSLSPNIVPLILIAGHSISRLPPLLLMNRYDYARTENSKSSAAIYRPDNSDLMFASALAILPFIVLPAVYLLTIIPVLLVNWQLGRFFNRQIGGYTGDCLGASQQIAETVFYLTVAALWTSI